MQNGNDCLRNRMVRGSRDCYTTLHMIRLLLATRNEHKVAELRALLGERFQCRTLRDFPEAPTAVEDADSFAGNAAKKALTLARWFSDSAMQFPFPVPDFVLADDSGLEVDVLNGAPGVHSARFAAMDSGNSGNSTDAANNQKLLALLTGVPPERRTARFRCVIALVSVDPARTHTPVLFAGECPGRIQLAPRGQGGFGYDPLFVPDGFNASFAELGDDIKNGLSHRAQALAKLKAALCP